MKIKTSALTGTALDWAVAKADSNLYPVGDVRVLDGRVFCIEPGDHETRDRWYTHNPEADWAQGGPIIEREKITTAFDHDYYEERWVADKLTDAGDDFHDGFGPTLLIAAMRCFVASKLGDEVEVPDELK